MLRHPEVLTPITDDNAQFERCLHITRQILVVDESVILMQEQSAFVAQDEKAYKVVEQRQGMVRELQGGEKRAAAKRLAEEAKTETRLFAQVADQEIPLSGASTSLALFQHRVTDELWVGKSDVLDGGVLAKIAVLKERIANDIYAYYGVPTPRLAIATLPCCYRTKDNQQIYGDEAGIVEASHLLSRWLDRFNTYPHMPDFSTPLTGYNYRIPIEDQLIIERGLGHVLAVAHFIHDVDVTNAHGKNIGYRLRIDAEGQLYAQTCKIDPGYAFHDVDHLDSPAYRLTQSMPFKTQQRERDYVPFTHFPSSTQAEFIATAADIVDTPEADLIKFFNRPGAESLQREDFSTHAITMLKTRQAALKTVFAKELVHYRTQRTQSERKESKPPLAPELQPLYAQSLLEASHPLFQQAEHFYLEPGTTDDNQRESKQQAFSAMLTGFLQHPDARVLLLLGDSGFGKSTATQHIVQQQWQSYLRENEHVRIPLRIELKQFTARTVRRCIENTLLDEYHLTSTQIDQLKQQPCLILLDGFDEIGDRAKPNLWDSNALSDWRDVCLIITCRNTYVAFEDKATCFYPAGHAQGLQERYLAPFGPKQIEAYLTKVLLSTDESDSEVKSSRSGLRSTRIESKSSPDKPEKLAQTLAASEPLQELLQVPLMLKIFSDTLPTLQKEMEDLTQINCFTLYAAFMQQWFERNRARLSQNLGTLISPTQCQKFLTYSQDLAFELFKAERVQVDYAPGISPWDKFFSQTDEITIRLRSGCPLRRAGNQYSFIHKSFYEFFLAQRIVQLANEEDDDLTSLIAMLSKRAIGGEPQVLLFLYQAHQAQQLPQTAQDKLLAVIRYSVAHPEIAQASSNAATILNFCQINLSNQNWQNVQLPGADFSYGLLAHTDLRSANLRGATLKRALLYQANLKDADLRDVRWGEWPYLEFKEGVTALAQHPTHAWLAVTQGDTIVIVDTETGEIISQGFRGQGRINSICFSPDGCLLASATDKTLCLWDVATKKALGTPWIVSTTNKFTVNSVCFSPNGRFLASAGASGSQTLRLWDVATQKALGAPLMGHTRSVNSVCFSPNSHLLASASDDRTLRLWDVATQKALGASLTGHTMGVASVCFSPDGCLLASGGGGGDRTVRLWDVATQKALGTPLTGHTQAVTSVCFSPDGRFLASGGARGDEALRLWDVATQKALGPPLTGHTRGVTSVCFSLGGRLLASGSADGTVRLWDVATQKAPEETLTEHTRRVASVSFSPDGRFLVSGTLDRARTLCLWDVATQKALRVPLTGHTQGVISVCFSPTGLLFASGSTDRTVRIWDVETQKTLGAPLTGHPLSVISVCFSPDGRLLAVSCGDGTLRLWDVMTQKTLGEALTGHTNAATSVSFSPNGRLLVSGSRDKTLRLWDVATQKALGAPLTGHSTETSVSFSPDGHFLVSAGAGGDHALRLWDVATLKVLGTPLMGHTQAVTSICFSPNGRLLVSGSQDKTVRLWDVTSGQCVAVIRWNQEILTVAMTECKSSSIRLTDSKHKSSESLTSIASTKEDLLAIGDAAGMISFWRVSRQKTTTYFLGMPRHSAMLLLVEGTALAGCRMDSTGKRLLAQYGGDVSGVVLEESTTAESKIVLDEEKQMRHKQHSLEYKAKHTSIDEKTTSSQSNSGRTLKAPGRFSLLGSSPLSSPGKPPSSSSSSSSNSNNPFGVSP